MKNARFETPEKGRKLQTSIDEAEKTSYIPETYYPENHYSEDYYSEDYFIVQFNGRIREEWKKNLNWEGAEILSYVPNNAYLVRMNSLEKAGVEALEEVRWVGNYSPEYKISPELSGQDEEAEEKEIIIVLFEAKDSANVSMAIEALGGTIHKNSGELIRTTLDPAKIPNIAALREIKWVEKHVPSVLYNDVARNITGVSGISEEYSLTGKGQIVCVADSGLDTGVNDASMHPDIRGRIRGIIDFGGDGAMDPDGHGTHVTGSVLGNGAASGGRVKGMAPEAELFFEAVGVNNSEYLAVPDNLTELIQPAYDEGARIHTNSWGGNANGAYTIYSQYTDQFMWDHPDMLIFFAAGNAGSDSNGDGVIDLDSIDSPATAKNCISVGASENNRPEINGTWGSYWPGRYPASPIAEDRISNNIEGVAAFSSRGPTDDGRIKPDIVAPGTFIASTRSSLANSDAWGYIDENYVYMGGTSMSTPITAGAAALVRQNYVDKLNTTPSAALIKATIINGAHNMAPGQYGTDSSKEINGCPDFSQGWGSLDAGKALYPAGERRIHFSDGPEIREGESYENKYYINNSSEPLKVTLVWTDYPADLPAEVTLVNDLDLYVTGPRDIQYTEADHKNNVEQVEIQNPEKGLYTVRVNGFNIPQGPQPFALVLSGATGELPRLDMINITPSYSKIAVGSTIELNVSTLDQYGNYFDAAPELSSSNATVGTINETTRVFTALKPGETTITAESGEINETALVQVFEPPSFSEEYPSNGSYLNNRLAKASVNITEGDEGIRPASINMTINCLPVEVNVTRIASGYRVEEPEAREYPEGMTRVSVNVTDNSTYLATHSWSFVVDTIAPTSTTPEDAPISANNNTNFTGWKLFDMNPGYYRILRDGKQLTPFTQWTNSTEIPVQVDTGIGLGAFNYTIQYNDSANNYGKQDTVIITINDPAPPIVNINSPLEGYSTVSDSITVYGTVDGTGTLPSVTVNDVPAETLLEGFSGTFTKTVPLPMGVNTIYANATDAAGNTDSVSVNVTRKEPRSPSGGSSSGGGGGGGGSPEAASNVQAKELSQQFVTNGNHISFAFTHEATPVTYVEFDARKTAGKTTTIVEELKGKSVLTPAGPEGEVYRHLNIWVGNEGFATQENIANATVGFRVNRTWIAEKNIDPDSISLQHFGDGQWKFLHTSKISQDEEYICFEAKTPGFSPFAITGNAKTGNKETGNKETGNKETGNTNETVVTQKMEILPSPENELKDDKVNMESSGKIDSEMEKPIENPSTGEKKIPAPGIAILLMLLTCAFLMMKKKT